MATATRQLSIDDKVKHIETVSRGSLAKECPNLHSLYASWLRGRASDDVLHKALDEMITFIELVFGHPLVSSK